jgi:hypothetical protein
MSGAARGNDSLTGSQDTSTSDSAFIAGLVTVTVILFVGFVASTTAAAVILWVHPFHNATHLPGLTNAQSRNLVNQPKFKDQQLSMLFLIQDHLCSKIIIFRQLTSSTDDMAEQSALRREAGF